MMFYILFFVLGYMLVGIVAVVVVQLVEGGLEDHEDVAIILGAFWPLFIICAPFVLVAHLTHRLTKMRRSHAERRTRP